MSRSCAARPPAAATWVRIAPKPSAWISKARTTLNQRLTLQARQPEHRISRLVDKLAVPVHGRPGGAARHGAQRLVCHLGRRIVGRGGRPVRAQLLEHRLVAAISFSVTVRCRVRMSSSSALAFFTITETRLHNMSARSLRARARAVCTRHATSSSCLTGS